MRSIAVYSLKGGVGKTSIAVNLAWAAASLSSRRTLMWDLDQQAAATYLLDSEHKSKEAAQAVFSKDVAPSKLVEPTAIPLLDLLASDISLRGLDRLLHDLGKKKRLAKLLERLGTEYDRILLDCPPGLTEISEHVLRAADLIIVPVIPSPLSQRALLEVIDFLDRNERSRSVLLPVYNMVDRRRSLHLDALKAHPKWPTIPMVSAVEAMTVRRQAVAAFAPRSPAAAAFRSLWRTIERRLVKPSKAG